VTQQAFILVKAGLFWRLMPSRMFVSVQEQAPLHLKVYTDHGMQLLDGNTSRDNKIKPLMLYHWENL
jgi:hypothetical protein